jgi:hypothetical protein
MRSLQYVGIFTLCAITVSTAGAQDLPRFGISGNVGTLGAGFEVATALTSRTNLRGGFSYFSYTANGNRDNLRYTGNLRLSSADVLVDQYLAGPFHVSGGALLFHDFRGKATVTAPAGQQFTLNGVSYFSSAADPVTGTGSVDTWKAAPVLLFGFGNLLPRSDRHFAANVDIGIAFQGKPSSKLNLAGSTCLAGPTAGCIAIAANPSVQANIIGEQNRLNNDLKLLQFFPILRVSFGYRF